MDTKSALENGVAVSTTSSAMSKTTTISTIAVQSGKTRIVIALLHCGDWINLKILEITPELSSLGNDLADALELQKAHEEVLRQLQNKQSPVEELLRQADQLIATQKPRAEVYAAMAESLGKAWKDINSNLELRKQILDLNVQYHMQAQEFFQKMDYLETSCRDTVVPIEIEAVKNFLTSIHDLRRALLESLMSALQAGNSLLAKLGELGAEGTLDSRPERIRKSVNRSISQVQGWLDELHIKRQILEATFNRKKTQLEQCLALAILAADLHELEDAVHARRELLANSNQYGDSSSSAELLLHEHKKLLPEAKQFQERALKITKATEQLVASGCFAEEQATTQSYVVLSATSDYLTDLQNREALLERVIAFFRSAQTVITKLDQLEIQLTATELSKTSPQLAQLHAQCSRAIKEATAPTIVEGYAILDQTGRGTSETEGVKRMVEELENKKINLDGLCTAHKEENIRINTALNNFLERHNEIYTWLVTIAEAFLQGHQEMGGDLAMAKDFLDLHSQLLNDLQIKGTEINNLLLTLPPILEYLEDVQRKDVDDKVEELHARWIKLKNILENRMDLAKIYVKFHTEADTVNKEMDRLDTLLHEHKDNLDEGIMKHLEEKFEALVPVYQSTKNTGITFIEQSKMVSEPHLDANRARLCVELVLERLAGRQLIATRNWKTIHNEVVEKRELLVRLQYAMAETTETIQWVSKLDTQLYPIITTNSNKPSEIADHIESKIVVVLPDIKKAQAEVEQRIKTAETLVSKGLPDENTLNVKNKLYDLNRKLVEISSEYQILLQVLIGYFRTLEEIDRKAEAFNDALDITGYPKDMSTVESIIREHESTKETIVERLRFAQTECQQISERIEKQEPETAAQQDISKLQYVLELRRAEFENQWRQKHDSLESHRQLTLFENDLQQINNNIDDLNKQVKNVKGQYGESVQSAKATSQAFSNLEKTIETLEQRVQTFIKTGEKLLAERHTQSPHIQCQLSDLQDRWNNLKNQMKTTRNLINLSIPYYELVGEAEDWFREGNKLLVTIARKSTTVKRPEEADELLNEICIFMKPGEAKQNERIQQIEELALQLYGPDLSKHAPIVSGNKEMMESFTSITKELNSLTSNLRDADEERQRIQREQAQAKLAEEARKEEESRLAEEKRLAEEARKAEEEKLAQARRRAEEARIAEEARLAKEKIKLEELRLAEERQQIEISRLAEEARVAEEKRLAEEVKRIEELKLAEERKKLGEERKKLEQDKLLEESRKIEEARLTELKRKEEEARIDELRKAEEARLEQQKQKLEKEKQIAEEERKNAEDAKQKAEEAKRQAEEKRQEEERLIELRKQEEAKLVEQIRLQEVQIEENKKAEQARLLEEHKKFEAEQKAQKLWEDSKKAEKAKLSEKQQVERKESLEITEITDMYKIDSVHSSKMRVPSPIPIIEDATEAPTFTSPLSDAVIQEGSKFTFICRVTGYPVPTITWYKAGISIQNNPDYRTTFDKGLCSLTIEETFAEDSARYTCRAVNVAGEAETTALLAVKETELEEVLAAPSFAKTLQPAVVKEGSTFQFECKVEGNPLPTVQWFKNSDCIDNSPDYIITYNNGEAIMKFEHVYLEDKAEYSCKATNQMGTAQSIANLIVTPMEPTESPTFIVPLSNVMARAGQKIKLECEVSGLPLPTLTWSHNGKPVKETRELKLQNEGPKATLIIYEAFPKDAGTYAVSAKNIVGETASSCSVSVKGRLPTETSDSEMASDMEPIKPSIQLPLTNTTVQEGNRIRLDCVIVGQPEPEVIWYHDNRLVKESPDFQLLFQGDRCSLVIQEALPEDAGEYKVVALNSAGEASSKCTLSVTASQADKPKDESIPLDEIAPKFTKLLADVLVSEGDKVILEGNVTGQPKPEIKWLLNNLPITDTEHFRLTYDNEGNVKLEIDRVKPDDKGVYTVKASNTVGEAKCFSQLIVKSFKPAETVKHEEVKLAPEFKELFHDRAAFEDTATKFECIVVAKPAPKAKWLFNGEPISGKDFLISTSGDRQVLSIPNLKMEHSGTITCVAENEVGKASCAATLHVQSSSSITLPEFQSHLHPSQQVIFQQATHKAIAPLKTEQIQHVETSYTINREVVTQSTSSQSSKIVSSSSEAPEPHTEEHKIVSQNEQTFKQTNQEAPEIKESQRIDEFHQIGQQPPVVHEKSTTTYTIGEKKDTDTQIKYIEQQIPKKPITKIRPPKFMTPVIGKIVDQNVDIVLEGILDGQPSPKVQWTKNGAELKADDRTKITWEFNKAKIEIKNVTTEDAGRYSCTAINDGGTAISTADLVVRKTIFPPVFGRRLQAQVIKKGDRITMEVEITGTPEPTVTWHKDGVPVDECLKDVANIKTMGQGHTLTIEKAELNHAGRFMVRAVNSGGEAQSIADIAVYEPTPDTMVEVVKTVVFEDVRKHETLTSSADKISSSITTPSPIPLEIPKIQVPLTSLSSDQQTSKSEVKSESVEETTKQYQTFKLEHKMPDIPMPKPLENKLQDVISETRFVSETTQPDGTTQYESEEKRTETQDGIETSSISKQSSLQYFVKKIQGDEPVLPKETVAPEPIKLELLEKFESKEIDEPIKIETKVPPPFVTQQPKLYSQDCSYQPSTQQILQEFDLKPEPPAEICYAPRQGALKKHEEVSERIKRITESQKDLSPHEVPPGGIKIFPTAPKIQKQFEEKKEFMEKKEQTSYQTYLSSYSQSPSKFEAERPVSVASSAYSDKPYYGRPLSAQSGSLEPSQEGIQMEKQWAHKFSEVHVEKQPSWSVQSTLEKKWTPTVTKSEKIIKETRLMPDLPKQHYIAEISNLGSTIDLQTESYSKTESNIIEERNVKPSEIIKTWPPLSAEVQVSQKPFNFIDSLSIRPVSVQDITDEVYLEPGPPPEIGYAEPPKQRRQSYVETVEQEISKNLEPSRVPPCSVRTIPPPKEWVAPPPLPPKQMLPQAPPLPAKPIRHVEPPFVPFEQFPQLEPFPYRAGPENPRLQKVGPPPTPSKFIKGRFTDSDYESDFETVRIQPKWKPSMSDTEEPTYRRVKAPHFTHTGRSRSTDPEPLPPSKFEQPPCFASPPRPVINFDDENRSIQVKKFSKHTRAQEIERKFPNPAPSYIHPIKKPDSPKFKQKLVMDGYMADTDEPFRQQQSITTEYNKEEYRHFSKTSGKSFESSSQEVYSSTKPRSVKFPMKKQQTTSTTKKELVATPIITSHTSKQVYEKHDKSVKTESFPCELESPKYKICKGPPPASPSKFTKGEFRESDYESDYEGRIPPVWHTDNEPTYKPVHPILKPSQPQTYYARTPTPPTEFEQPPVIEASPRPKFQPIEKFTPEPKPATTPFVYKPKPISATSGTELIVLKPGSPPEMRYSPGPKRTQYYKSTVSAPYTNAVQTETSNVVHFNESTDNCHRTMSVQQTHKVIKFGDQYKKQEETSQQRRATSVPPPATPTKFLPGEFRESDYESEVDSARIKPKWSPSGADADGVQYRRVRGPANIRSSSAPAPKERVLTPMEFDIQPPLMPASNVYEAGSRRHSESTYKKFSERREVLQRAQSYEPALQPGSPPEYGYNADQKITKSSATKFASQHMDSMTQAFKSKTQKFVTDIMGDVNKQVPKPILKRPADADAQVYREDTRAAQYGTKHVDPDTGLIYFKYDFGYEFGIILPGESKQGGSVPITKKTKIEPPKRTVDIEMPVHHEKSTTNQTPTPQFKPKKFTPGKWEPTSESEMSEYDGDASKRTNNLTGRTGATTPPSCPSTPGSTKFISQPGQAKAAPMFITPLRDIAVVSGQPAKFECIVQSEPSPNILWSKNGRIIENSIDYQLHYRNGVCRLTISQAYPEDAGTYSCTASNSVGTANTIATLQVPGERRSQYIK